LGVPDADGGEVTLRARQGGVLDDGDRLALRASDAGARALLLAARPIGEPVVQYGPFVMNTREEIDEAIRDFQSGRLAGPAPIR
jgi:hypothetical protein